ncbi:hypothetical protein X975_16581, partial [Stegodyphus mimosarum]
MTRNKGLIHILHMWKCVIRICRPSNIGLHYRKITNKIKNITKTKRKT